MRLKDILNFNKLYWLFVVWAAITFAIDETFAQIYNSILQKRFKVDETEINDILAMGLILSMVLMIVSGYISDRYGYRSF